MYKPHFIITPKIASYLMRIEAIREEFNLLPITSHMLASLRETARYESVHYSTQIEGNRLTQEEVIDVITKAEHIPGRERDEKEVLGYYAALDEVENLAKHQLVITQEVIKKIHGLVMAGGKKRVKPSAYRDGQNVIRDSNTRTIVYMPPEAKDVPQLMKELVSWIASTEQSDFPQPLIAGIAHYQFATIHPYYDGNGRTARLLATLVLHKGGYGLRGIYSLEEYYAKDLNAYYIALDAGPSHNYYFGREGADITGWLDYFCLGVVESFEKVRTHALYAAKQGRKDKFFELSRLHVRKRRALSLFEELSIITAKDIESFFKVSPRTARALCQQWVKEGFLRIVDSSKKSRKYALAPTFQDVARLS